MPITMTFRKPAAIRPFGPDFFFTPRRLAILCFLLVLISMPATVLAVTSRSEASVGVIASASGDAEIRFVEGEDWRLAETRQDLLTGDGLRTGDLGSLALVFHDRTQIRVHRNSSLIVKAVSKIKDNNQSVFELKRGGAWARSPSGDAGVAIETPSATAAIRGTDWSLTVDAQGRTTLIVLSGEVVLMNPFGSVTVTRGEIAFAEIGKAPGKTVLVAPSDRVQVYYNMSLAEALRLFPVTDLKTGDQRMARKSIESLPENRRTPIQLLDLAELAHDMGDIPAAFDALSACPRNPETSARIDFIKGYLAVFKDDFKDAIRLFEKAEPFLDPDRRVSARIGRAGSLLLTRQAGAAKGVIQMMEAETPNATRFLMFKVMLAAFSGDLEGASELSSKYGDRFPDKALFPAMKGLLALLLDRREEAREASRQTLAIDPEHATGYFIEGHYRAYYLHDSEGAADIIQQGLSFNENNSDLWGALGWIYLEMGEARKCEDALNQALAVSPSDMADLFNYMLMLLDQHRMNEAGEVLQKMTALDPGRDFLLAGQGRYALQAGEVSQARETFLKATAVNPMMTQAYLGLAIASYQAGDPALARQTLANAARIDPNDPEIPLTAAVMALDRSEADEAVMNAREAVRRYRLMGGAGISGLASTRGGNNTLGAAFGNLSLSSWANYYNELSFDPYSADSHFYRAVHDEDVYSSLYQGLLLDPLACSARNRYTDFFRRPFTDSSAGVAIGHTGEGVRHGENANIQGFSHSLLPVSYYLNLQTDDSQGFRDDNDDRDSITGSAFAGFNLTPHDRVLLDVNAVDQTRGLPGTVSAPDGDDENKSEFLEAGIGYSHSFSARNVFMGRVMAYRTETRIENADPLGRNLSLIDYSLISNFGEEGTRMLHDAGLMDYTLPDAPNSPILVVGKSGETIPDTIPQVLDTKTGSLSRETDGNLSLQLRHMVTMGQADLSFGAEGMGLNNRNRLDSLNFKLLEPGTGTLVGPAGSMNFLYGEPVAGSTHASRDGYGANAHADVLWRINRRLWTEAGLFGVTYDDDDGTDFSEVEPRTGIAWQPDDANWLRLVYRKDARLPVLTTLAPVATVGLTRSESFMAMGGRSSLLLARWDREWTPWLFTALETGQRKIKDFSASGADNSLDSYSTSRGRIDYAALSANCWLRGGFGLFGEALFRDTENLNDEDSGHTDLPLVPERVFRTGLTFIHPSQVRLDLTGNIHCSRPSDLSARENLENYGTLDFLASWQPFDKRLKFGFAVNNIFDADYDVAKEMPGPGRNYMANLEARF